MRYQYLHLVCLSVMGLLLIGCDQKPDVSQRSEYVKVYDPELISSSWVLVVEGGGKHAYVINKAGEKQATWTFDLGLGNDFKLLNSGYGLGIFKHPDPPFHFGGGYGGWMKIYDRDSVIWEFEYASPDYLSHHDTEELPNGNILFLAWERIDSLTAKSKGVLVNGDIFPEKLIEINPVTKEIVWEWRSWDHIVQDKDATLGAYGDIAENANRININFVNRKDGDIMHANGIEHDPARDIVFITVNFFSEVWVIDHSTTTSQAATDSGGTYGNGGRLLYRFGNPDAYNNNERPVYFDRVHAPVLIPKNYPGAGNLLVYSNGLKAKQSTVYEFELPDNFTDNKGMFTAPKLGWSFTDSTLSYGRISGAQRLKNGNTLICEGDFGYWEVTEKGEIVWKYEDTRSTYWRGYAIEEDHPLRTIHSGN